MRPRRALVAGGGPAAIEAVLALRRVLAPGSEIVLVAPNEYFVYRPLSVAEPFGAGKPWSYPLGRIAELAGAAHRRDALAGVDVAAREAALDSGHRLSYDALLVAIGARPVEGVPGAITFRGADGDPEFAQAIDRLQSVGGQIVFKVPHRVRWTLPLYELAMLSASELQEHGLHPVTVSIVTPEAEPLALVGGEVSAELAARLHRLGVHLHLSADPLSPHRLAEPAHSADERVVVALPHWVGRSIPGLPSTQEQFLETDDNQRVLGAPGVYAAGDITDNEVKQGGLATEQAAAAATTIGADLGYTTRPGSVEPILRARLYSRGKPLFMRARLGDAHRHAPEAADAPLWWPGSKLYGRHLTPFLAEIALSEGIDAMQPAAGAPR